MPSLRLKIIRNLTKTKSLQRSQLRALFPPQVHEITDKNHGRIEIRKISLIPARPVNVTFPHATQVFSITRTRLKSNGEFISEEVVYGVSTHDPKKVGAKEILQMNRAHWVIESIHCIRDELFQEDRCRIRKENGPRIMATLRNLAITLLKNRGVQNLAATAKGFLVDKKNLWRFLGVIAGNVKFAN